MLDFSSVSYLLLELYNFCTWLVTKRILVVVRLVNVRSAVSHSWLFIGIDDRTNSSENKQADPAQNRFVK